MTKFKHAHIRHAERIFMANKSQNIEEMLLTGASLDDLIRMKIEAEFKTEIENAKTRKTSNNNKIYTEIKEVPQNLIFSKQAVFKLFNRNTKQETFINGVQAEALIGLQDNVRQKFLNGEMSAFSTDEAYVKFEKVCVNS